MKVLQQQDKRKLKKAFSLSEVLVSIGIVGIIIVIFFNALSISLEISVKNLARSNIREELTSISALITRDIRFAEQLIGCNGTSSCQIILEDRVINWNICETNRVCKTENDGTGEITTFQSNPNLAINTLTFESGFGSIGFDSQLNILVTLVGSHQNDELNIRNQVRQFTVSTRNYEF